MTTLAEEYAYAEGLEVGRKKGYREGLSEAGSMLEACNLEAALSTLDEERTYLEGVLKSGRGTRSELQKGINVLAEAREKLDGAVQPTWRL